MPSAVLDETARLMKTCFGESAGQSYFAARASEKRNPLLILAFDGENAVAFKLGYEKSRSVFMSWLGGPHPDHRHGGLPRRCSSGNMNGSRTKAIAPLRPISTNDYTGMLILNLNEGFRSVGTHWSSQRGSLGVLFFRLLQLLPCPARTGTPL